MAAAIVRGMAPLLRLKGTEGKRGQDAIKGGLY